MTYRIGDRVTLTPGDTNRPAWTGTVADVHDLPGVQTYSVAWNEDPTGTPYAMRAADLAPAPVWATVEALAWPSPNRDRFIRPGASRAEAAAVQRHRNGVRKVAHLATGALTLLVVDLRDGHGWRLPDETPAT